MLSRSSAVGLAGSQSGRSGVAKHDHLLVFPLTYKGLEESPYVIYMGGAPNQQLLPAVQYAYTKLKKKKFFLIGVEGVYSNAAHAIMTDEIRHLGGKWSAMSSSVGQPPLPRDRSKDQGRPGGCGSEHGQRHDGQSCVLPLPGRRGRCATRNAGNLFPRQRGRPGRIDGRPHCRPMAAWSYFQSLSLAENREFFQAVFHCVSRPGPYGQRSRGSLLCGGASVGSAVRAAKIAETAAIRTAFVDQRLAAPEGELTIDAKNRHAWRTGRIGQVIENPLSKRLEFKIVDVSPEPVEPQPFPPSRLESRVVGVSENHSPARRETASPTAAPAR